MTIVRPVIFTPIEDSEVVINSPVSEETVRKMIQNSNLLASLAIVGSIRHVALNQTGVPTPSGDVWQLADGGEITHPNSPIATVIPFNRFTPNLLDRYVRGAADAISNVPGGSPTLNLAHNHGGLTAAAVAPPLGSEGFDKFGYNPVTHSHTISSDLNSSEPLEVAHQEVAVYLKIN